MQTHFSVSSKPTHQLENVTWRNYSYWIIPQLIFLFHIRSYFLRIIKRNPNCVGIPTFCVFITKIQSVFRMRLSSSRLVFSSPGSRMRIQHSCTYIRRYYYALAAATTTTTGTETRGKVGKKSTSPTTFSQRERQSVLESWTVRFLFIRSSLISSRLNISLAKSVSSKISKSLSSFISSAAN